VEIKPDLSCLLFHPAAPQLGLGREALAWREMTEGCQRNRVEAARVAAGALAPTLEATPTVGTSLSVEQLVGHTPLGVVALLFRNSLGARIPAGASVL
jgi:hypothetical protein